MIYFHDFMLKAVAVSAQAKCQDVIGDDAVYCLDAPMESPAGSTKRVDENAHYVGEAFAFPSRVYRDGFA
jgi:hypothetical protein